MNIFRKVLLFLPRLLYKKFHKSVFSDTIESLKFDILKLSTRLRTNRMYKNYLKKNTLIPKKLHFGCGTRLVTSWLNIDLLNSDIDVDFTVGKLPLFHDEYFDRISTQHVVEHLDMNKELPEIFNEFYRILKPSGILWISCPCIKKIASSYLLDKGKTLVEGRKSRFPDYSTNGFPNTVIINELFHQSGSHKNLFDYDLLSFMLRKAGFEKIFESNIEEFTKDHQDFPARPDAEQTLYVKAIK